MSKYVTDEMVEKGAAEARAWGVKSSHGDWSDEETQRNCARDILEVAAPLIAAEALREAADGYQIGGWSDDIPIGPSRPALILGMSQRAVKWLRDRANKIEQAGKEPPRG